MSRLDIWRRPVNQLFAFDSDWDALFNDGYTRREERSAFLPATEVQETESHFVLSFDVPGLSKDDIKIEVEGDLLTVSGERKFDAERTKNSVHHTERSYGRFTRSFTLPKGTDTSNLEANYKDGVLHIAVAKSEAAKPRKVEIKSEDTGFFQKILGAKKTEKLAS